MFGVGSWLSQEVLVQAAGPEFGSPQPHKKPGTAAMGRRGHRLSKIHKKQATQQ